MARSLGLDVGNRRIGVAVSDASKIIARPLEVIDRQRVDAVQRIAGLVEQHQADEVVIGYPYNADGSEGEQAWRVKQFAGALAAWVRAPLRFCDERYSTSHAQEIIAARKRKDRTGGDDAVAAAVILQRYLDEHSHALVPDEMDDDA